MELWIFAKVDRDAVAAILVANGYTVSQIEKPDPSIPYSTLVKLYGLKVVRGGEE